MLRNEDRKDAYCPLLRDERVELGRLEDRRRRRRASDGALASITRSDRR